MQEQSTDTPSKLDHTNSFTFREAAGLVGVSPDTIKRRQRSGMFPGAEQVQGRTGLEWRIPSSDIAAAAEKEGWTFDLTNSLHGQQPGAESSDLARLIERAEAASAAQAKLEHAQKDMERLTRERNQARNDLEHTQAALDELETEHNEAQKATAVAEALAAERQTQIKELSEKRDSLEEKVRETESESAEKLSAASKELAEEQKATEKLTNELADRDNERDELLQRTEKLESSLGWWARRKYERQSK